MISSLKRLNRAANRRAGTLFLVGLAGVAWHNWRLWQRDKELLAKRADPPPRPPLAAWPALPPVSVLVAAWNEAEMIERHVESFLGLRYPHKELVLCAGGRDGTYELARRAVGARVTVLQQRAGEGKQRALARCLAQAQGEVIFLTDADCLLDDDAFERTLYPVAAGEEEASAGTLRPLPQQMDSLFVVSQAASQIYASLRAPEHAPGLPGYNCAIRRDLLVRSRGLEVPAASGTDYVLAKELVRCGARIRQVPHSRVMASYPTAAGAYLRQQRRWLRNVALHGWRYGAHREFCSSLRTSLLGVAMLLLPFAGLLTGPWLLAAWGALAAKAILARWRYLHVAGRALHHRVRTAHLAWAMPLLLLDLVAWTQPLADYLPRRGRWEW